MAFPVTADAADDTAFAEAVAWFRSRLPITDQEYETLVAEERARAFVLAGATELAVVQDVADEILGAITTGEGVDTWARRTRKKLKGRWLEPKSRHLELVFVNATQTAYGTGRWFQQQDPELVAVRPFVMYDAVLDSRTSELCRSLGSPPVIRLHDDPFVAEYWPPNHHWCRGQWQSISRRRVRELGGVTLHGPFPAPTEGFGKAPPLRGDDWQPDPETHDPVLFASYLEKQEALSP